MTHTDTQQAIKDIMESLGENIEYDQLINKLADKNIINVDEVSRINRLEDSDKLQELLITLLGKDQSLHPLVLRILETMKSPCPETRSSTDRAIQHVAAGSRAPSLQQPERRMLSTSDVSNDWELKNFLFELSKDISDPEFQDMKDLMHGETGFKSQALEKMNRPMAFFQTMTNTGRLNCYNLVFLQHLVRRIGRTDLNKKVRHFCLESNKKPIHFFTPSEVPENGYKYVKHHIEGGIEKLTHLEKERIRAEVASILCVPVISVFISGIEPSNSLLITFMVPEEDVHSFIQIYAEEGASSFQLSVHIHIEEKELSFSECPPRTESPPQPMFQHLKNLLEREQSLKAELEGRDERLVSLQAELESTESDTTVDQVLRGEDDDDDDDEEECSQGRLQNELYKNLFLKMMDIMKTMQPREYKNGSNGHIESLKLSSVSKLHISLLEKFKRNLSGTDVALVNKLLDTKALIERYMYDSTFQSLNSMVRMLTQSLEKETRRNQVLRMTASIGGSSNFLQDILAVQANNISQAVEEKQDQQHGLGLINVQVFQQIIPAPVQLELNPEIQQVLRNMSTEGLSQKDRTKLKNFLCFSDAEKEQLKTDPSQLLELAVLKEVRAGRHGTPIEMLLNGILAKIRKSQLVQKYLSALKQAMDLIQSRQGQGQRI